MLEELEDEFGWDQVCFKISSYLEDTFLNTYGRLGYRLVSPLIPGQFENAGLIQEIAIRALIVVGAVLSTVFAGSFILGSAAILGFGGKLFRLGGMFFQKNGFTHIRGETPEKSLERGQAKIMAWNIRGQGGGRHFKEAGVTHWTLRIDSILSQIREEDPDVLVLLEAYDPRAIDKIVSELKDRYAHIFAYTGVHFWGDGSGSIVLTKCAVKDFSTFEFARTDERVRSFSFLEIQSDPKKLEASVRIIASQLSPGEKNKEIRKAQVEQIVSSLREKYLALPTFLVGGFLDRDSKEGQGLLKYLYQSYQGQEPTETYASRDQWNGQEKTREDSCSDWISLFKRTLEGGGELPVVEKGIKLEDVYLRGGLDAKASSDHQAVIACCGGL